MKKNDVLLDVRNVHVDYLAANGNVHAVRNVSFMLKRGEIIGLAGESGSGKSTLAFAIARLLRPPAQIMGGEIYYYPTLSGDRIRPRAMQQYLDDQNDGRIDVLSLNKEQLRTFRWNELSVVFQSAMNALNPVMNIGNQMMDVIRTHRPDWDAATRKKRASELLQAVGIAPDRLTSYPHELSGGMRQRVVIAIALVLEPELIIMDEPTTALDVVVQREILELVSSLCKETGTSMIFITHDLSLLLELCDKIAVMYAGKLVELAAQNELYEHPRHPYTYGLMNSFPTIYGPRRLMTGIPGSPPDLRNIPTGCPFHERCPFAFAACQTQVPELKAAVASLPNQVAACHLYTPELTQQPGIPETADLARGYEALARGSRAR